MVTVEVESSTGELMSFLPTQVQTEGLSNQSIVTVVALVEKDVDILAQMEDAFHNFIDSGQGWALLIGVVLGYLFRSFTSY